jgi:CspA family cold shock protein
LVEEGKRVMQTGVVKWWSDERAYGFITPDDGGPDVFLQPSGLANKLRWPSDDDRVEFNIVTRRDRTAAERCRILRD